MAGATSKAEAAQRQEAVRLMENWVAEAYPEGGPQHRSTARIIRAGDQLLNVLVTVLGIDPDRKGDRA